MASALSLPPSGAGLWVAWLMLRFDEDGKGRWEMPDAGAPAP